MEPVADWLNTKKGPKTRAFSRKKCDFFFLNFKRLNRTNCMQNCVIIYNQVLRIKDITKKIIHRRPTVCEIADIIEKFWGFFSGKIKNTFLRPWHLTQKMQNLERETTVKCVFSPFKSQWLNTGKIFWLQITLQGVNPPSLFPAIFY